METLHKYYILDDEQAHPPPVFNNTGKMDSKLEYIYFSNAFVADLHTVLAFITNSMEQSPS
jgi:hypothetical protein